MQCNYCHRPLSPGSGVCAWCGAPVAPGYRPPVPQQQPVLQPYWFGCSACGAQFDMNLHGERCPQCNTRTTYVPPLPMDNPLRPSGPIDLFKNQHRYGWRWVKWAMSSRRERQSNLLQAVVTTAGTVSVISAYVYWDMEGATIDNIFGSVVESVVRYLVIAIGIVFGLGALSLVFPLQRAQRDRLWFLRTLGGPAVAIGTFFLPFAVVGAAPYLAIPLFGMWIAATVAVFNFGARYQFRLIDAHPALPSVLVLISGVMCEFHAIKVCARDGLNPAFPIWVGILITFLGPLVTIGFAAYELRIEIQRTGGMSMIGRTDWTA